ncbi:MAG: flagellar biosynthesis protein FliQ [Rhodobacterales bacterium]|nr:flagellar biosynthesis protein FliQ [Rhodobacterales bacterium]
MSEEHIIFYGQQALITCLMLAGPLLVTALVVGTAVSILQAVTQVQEMTLVFVPKMLSVFLVMALAGSWMLQVAVSFGVQMFLEIPVHN